MIRASKVIDGDIAIQYASYRHMSHFHAVNV